MTSNRDPDRIVRAWLDLMPDEAPDRTVAAVLQAVEGTPQVRRPLVGGPRRYQTVNRFALIAAVAVLGAAMLGGVVFIAGGGSPPKTGPSPAPPAAQLSAAPSVAPTGSAPALAAIPTSLQYRWIGQPRDVPGHGTSTRTGLNFGSDTFYLTGTEYGSESSLLPSIASIAGDGKLHLATKTVADCSAGDVGTYAWSLSPGGTVLTVEPGTDDCAARAAAMPGSWYRIACTNTQSACIGKLEAGTYKSQYIAPRLDVGASWKPDLGAMTHTVPADWANSTDWPNTFTLTPAADYALEGPDGPPNGDFHEVYLFTQPFAAVQDKACSSKADASVDRSVAGLIAWLRTLPSLTVSAASSITIDGHPGKVVDVGLAKSWKSSCPGDTAPSALFFAQAGDRQNDYGVGIVAGERTRLILLDLGGGDVLGILIDSRDPTRFDELATAAMPVIESFRFR